MTRARRRTLGEYVFAGIVASGLLLWIFQPPPVWGIVAAVPHWIYYAAAFGPLAVLLLVDTIRKRLHPPPEPVEPDLSKYSIQTQPTTAAIVVAFLAPFGWYVIDHVIAPGMQRFMPAIAERASFLAIVLIVQYVSAKISNSRAANNLSPEVLTPPSS